ncbi:ABC-type transport system involved in multi-copper enzyme maturation, permease component [Listeria grayi]|uniref:ABC-2 type transporter n=1 Tax=Listeria grayi FSL F6-1183 TaxID=1265827 RepID=A0A829R803_LISGR|nr:ABC transporter permease [Listeria grayi]EUJ28310.1 ABC-2 type transporter [Listeria grayi FSL F6-1183]VEI36286.1 ABC-type transport system involved in multi-copper enzyme maturation, permease component [Listeria grayi]
MHMNRIHAMIEKDLKEFLRNPALFFMPLVVFLFSYIYRMVSQSTPNGPHSTLIYSVISMAFIAASAAVILALMTEEQEKGTLEGLTESPATSIEILSSKAVIGIIISIITTIISLFILNLPVHLQPIEYAALVILLLLFTMFGLIAGLLAKSAGSSTFYNMLLFFIFGMSIMYELFFPAIGSPLFEKIILFLPSNLAYHLHADNKPINFVYLSIWLIAAIIVLTAVFKSNTKKR